MSEDRRPPTEVVAAAAGTSILTVADPKHAPRCHPRPGEVIVAFVLLSALQHF